MPKMDRKQLLKTLSHRPAYTLDKNALRLDCAGFDDRDRLLMVRILASSLIFLIALVLDIPTWASICLLEIAAIAVGYDVIVSAVMAASSLNFRDPSFIITVIALLSLIIGSPREEAASLLIFQIGELFLRLSSQCVRDNMLDACIVELPDKATLVRGDIETNISVSDLAVNDLIAVFPGNTVPVDCTVAESGGAVDVSAITGNTEPMTVQENDIVYSGSVAVGSKLMCHVKSLGSDSAAQRLDGTVDASGENVCIDGTAVNKFAFIYLLAMSVAAVLTAILVPVLSDVGILAGIHRGVSVLALSLPCSFLAALPLVYFSGGLALRKKGVVFRSAAAVERASRTGIVVFDKQGTLTASEQRVTSVKSDKMDAKMMLKIAAYAEAYSSHPIAKSIINAYGDVIYIELVQKFREFPGEGVAVLVQDIPIVIGSQSFLERLGISVRVDGGVERAVFMAINGAYAGRIIFASSMREKAPDAVRTLEENDVVRIALTTDESSETAKSFASSVGIREVHSQVDAAGKASVIKKLKASMEPGQTLLFAGGSSGLEQAMDAADLSAVIGDGSSCFEYENADIMVFGGPEKLADAVVSAKITRNSVKISLLAAAIISFVLLILSIFGIAATWFVLVIEAAVSVATVLLSGRLMFFCGNK